MEIQLQFGRTEHMGMNLVGLVTINCRGRQNLHICLCSSVADTEVQDSTAMACSAAEQNIVLPMLTHECFYTESLA